MSSFCMKVSDETDFSVQMILQMLWLFIADDCLITCVTILLLLCVIGSIGAVRGVTVSMSAFLACHQCYCAASSLAWGLNLQALVCGIF